MKLKFFMLAFLGMVYASFVQAGKDETKNKALGQRKSQRLAIEKRKKELKEGIEETEANIERYKMQIIKKKRETEELRNNAGPMYHRQIECDQNLLNEISAKPRQNRQDFANSEKLKRRRMVNRMMLVAIEWGGDCVYENNNIEEEQKTLDYLKAEMQKCNFPSEELKQGRIKKINKEKD